MEEDTEMIENLDNSVDPKKDSKKSPYPEVDYFDGETNANLSRDEKVSENEEENENEDDDESVTKKTPKKRARISKEANNENSDKEDGSNHEGDNSENEDNKEEKNPLDKSYDLSTDEDEDDYNEDIDLLTENENENNNNDFTQTNSEFLKNFKSSNVGLLEELQESMKDEDKMIIGSNKEITTAKLESAKLSNPQTSESTATTSKSANAELKKKNQAIENSNRELARRKKLEQMEEENKKMQ